ncbi:MAG: hypothetical protein QM703_00020 [Gemmatales bacterium]
MVRYSSVMRLGKQHPMRISLTGTNPGTEPVKPQSLSGGFDPPILVQVTIPGALVTPTHQIIPLSGGDANFMIQPLSTGRLKGAKVEFHSQGRKISEIPLPIKANRGSLAKWLIALGILLPFIINLMPEPSFQSRANFNADGVQQVPRGNDGTAPNTKTGARISGDVDRIKSSEIEQDSSRAKSKDTPPAKSGEKTPNKAPAKPSATLRPAEQIEQLIVGLVVCVQPPTTSNRSAESPSKEDSPRPRVMGRTETPQASVLSYRGEDAIWAWTRHKLAQNGYQTKSISIDPMSGELSRFLTVDRTYQIVGTNSSDWTSGRVAALGMYYLEPVWRLLYRIFIQFPKDVPMADLGFALLFIALGVILWVVTGPNRKKITGPVMDIRLAT